MRFKNSILRNLLYINHNIFKILSIWNNSLVPSPFSFLKTTLEGLTSEALSAASSNTLHTPGYSSRILSIWNNSLAPSPFSFLKTSLEGFTSEALSAASSNTLHT
ncbi:hypothetical protein AVEN_63665-1, partial [Araneus ventricosus]